MNISVKLHNALNNDLNNKKSEYKIEKNTDGFIIAYKNNRAVHSKYNIENECKRALEKINKNNNLDEKQILNQELKIRLNNTIRDISRVAGLMANNTIIDEDTLSLVKKLKNELRFLNEQTELYSSQQKF